MFKRVMATVLATAALTTVGAGYASAVEPKPVVYRLDPSTTEDVVAPIVNENVKTYVYELGHVQTRSDNFVPMRRHVRPGHYQDPMDPMACGQPELEQLYSKKTKRSKPVFSAPRSLFRQCLTHVGKYANEACGPASNKSFVWVVTLEGAGHFTWASLQHLALKNGKFVYAHPVIHPKAHTTKIRMVFHVNALDQVDTKHKELSTGILGLNYGAGVASSSVHRVCSAPALAMAIN